jgi:hypothetical protein
MLEFVRLMWVGVVEAMRLNPRAFAFVEATPESGRVVLAIAVLGGASLLLGQSVILFVNRVSPGRFVLSLLLNGVIFTLGLLVWAVAIWLTARVLFGAQLAAPIPFGPVARLVGLGAAPYVFGFLVLLPYAGAFIGRVLSVWSFLVVLAGLTGLAGGNFGAALVCTAVGWTLIALMSATVGRPIIYARNRIWRRLTGADMDASVQDILGQFATDDPRTPPTKGGS